MKLLIILICLLGFRYAHFGRSALRYQWFNKYAGWWQRVLTFTHQPWLITAIILVPILVLVAILQYILAHRHFQVMDFIFATLMLWYSIWPITLAEQLNSSLNEDAANDRSGSFLNDEERVPVIDGDTRNVIARLLCNANSRLFAVLFWFILLGPWGALLYRCVTQLAKLSRQPKNGLEYLGRVVSILENLLDWFPARITGFSYVLAGDFRTGFGAWTHHFNGGLHSNNAILIASGLGSTNINAEKRTGVNQALEALHLTDRATLIWVLALVIFTLGSLHLGI